MTAEAQGARPRGARPRSVLVWFRDDLRVADNPALRAALDRGGTVIAVYVLDEQSPGVRPLGGAAKWWLHHSLAALTASLADLGIALVLRSGPASREVPAVAARAGAAAVVWNRRYGGPERAVDRTVRAHLAARGIGVESFAATLLFEPGTILTRDGAPYSVFTPFWRACLSRPSPRRPLPPPAGPPPSSSPSPAPSLLRAETLELDDLELLPGRPDWAGGLDATWEPGEAAAQRALRSFVRERLAAYSSEREIPSIVGTSRLSPHLRWGELSPHQVWHTVVQARQEGPGTEDGAAGFLTELGWREFAWHTLHYSPGLATRNWRAEFDGFPWPARRPDLLRAWQEGRTGVALVDAGMRELWRTGWMHNRVRMVTASFLTKNLLIDWRVGEQWFWDTLVDADAASNPFNWQWIAGSGADAAPYFRIFNPDRQARRFDPDGAYIRANVEEWGTAAYPAPVVDLGRTRAEALAAHSVIRRPVVPLPPPVRQV